MDLMRLQFLAFALLSLLGGAKAVVVVQWTFTVKPNRTEGVAPASTTKPAWAFYKVSRDRVVPEEVTVTCDASGTSGTLSLLGLKKVSGMQKKQIEVTLSRGTNPVPYVPPEEVQEGFKEGMLDNKTLSFVWASGATSPNLARCSEDPTTFTCSVQEDTSPKEEFVLEVRFEAMDSAVDISPVGNANERQVAGQTTTVDCRASLGGVTNVLPKDFVDKDLWFWEVATTGADGNVGDWSGIKDDHKDALWEEFNTIVNTASTEVQQCRTIYITSRLERILRRDKDNAGKYRCSYKHPDSPTYSTASAGIHTVGIMEDPPDEASADVKTIIIYSASSLYLLVFGATALGVVLFMIPYYFYRKYRTGKKYHMISKLRITTTGLMDLMRLQFLAFALLSLLGGAKAAVAVRWTFSSPANESEETSPANTTKTAWAYYQMNRDGVMGGTLTVTCDASGTSGTLGLLGLKKKTGFHGIIAEATLSTATPNLPAADSSKGFYNASLTEKHIAYQWIHPANQPKCAEDPTTLTCSVREDTGVKQEFVLEVRFTALDGVVEMRPLGNPDNKDSKTGDTTLIDCRATMGGVKKPMPRDFVEKELWRWELSKMNTDGTLSEFVDIMDDQQDPHAEEFNNIINFANPDILPCRTVYITSRLERRLRSKIDHQGKLRCSYKHPGNTSSYSSLLGSIHSMGHIFDPPDETFEVQTVIIYTPASMYLMVFGASALGLVLFMIPYYIYRKFRTGKKYHMVSKLLDIEEAQLHKIEVKLGKVRRPAGESEAESVSEAESSTAKDDESATEA